MTHKINTRPPHTLSYDIMSDFFENLAINDSYNFDFSVYEVCTQSSGLPEMINIDNFHKGKELVQHLLTLLNFQRFLNQNNITVEPISGYKQDYLNNAGKNYLKVVKVANKNVASFIKESNEQ